VHILRQHHAIEHATVTLLGRRMPGRQVVARSDLQGFMVYGSVETDILQATALEALARLQAGEADLAVHPNCGTNLVAAGMLSGLAALAAGSGRNRSLWDRAPSAILGATLALIVAVPLGRWAQANLTTTDQVEGLRIISVIKIADFPVTRHRVVIGE
jgi:fructose-1,6-bisphosphatase/sedoheptulose 1,7-bisphosphatase-like protein